MNVLITVKENTDKNQKMILGFHGGKFIGDGKFKGEFHYSGATMLINLEDGRQYEVNLGDIIEEIEKQLLTNL